MKKLLSLLLICALTLVSYGCTPSTQNTTKSEDPAQTSADKPADNQTTTPQSDESGKKLVIALQTNSFVTDYDDNYFTKYLENKLGIDIEFYQLPAANDEVRTKVSLMTASGSNLPDILIVSNALTPETILQYGITVFEYNEIIRAHDGVFSQAAPLHKICRQRPN